jgi:hypothetical protein
MLYWLRNTDPAVRREVLLALKDADAEKAKPLIVELMHHCESNDRFYLEAIGIAVGHDPKRREIILGDFAKQFPEWNNQVAGLVWELRPPGMMPVLEKRLVDVKVPAAQRAQIVDILAGSDDAKSGLSLLNVLRTGVPDEVRDRILGNLKQFLPGKWRNLRDSKELKETIDALLSKPELRATGLALVGAAERKADLPRVTEFARDAHEKEPVRKAAVQALGRLPTANPSTLFVD